MTARETVPTPSEATASASAASQAPASAPPSSNASAEASATTAAEGRPTVLSMQDLTSLAGRHLGYSAWHAVTQDQVNAFATATGDHQWLHVDPERAKSGPFGLTIAHGFLTLSLFPALLDEILHVEGAGMIVNYGLNRVRFTGPVTVGSQVRIGVECLDVKEFEAGLQVLFLMNVERQGEQRPACVAEIIFRYYR